MMTVTIHQRPLRSRMRLAANHRAQIMERSCPGTSRHQSKKGKRKVAEERQAELTVAGTCMTELFSKSGGW